MKDQKNQIVTALTTKHIQSIKTTKLSNISGGDGCIVVIDPQA